MRMPSAIAAALITATTATAARADVTSWLAVGGGYGFQTNDATATTDTAPALTASLGVGSSPERRLIAGGVFRTVTHFGLGTDASLSARLATQGFVRGGFGVAADLGAAYRPWRSGNYGDVPLQGIITIGFPAGLQLGLGGTFWNLTQDHPALGAFAVLEVDLLRLTLMRRGVLDEYWPNPSAAGDIGRGK
jgi:hypothetical protein